MLSVLLVDDDVQIRQLLREYLSDFDMNVTAVGDGKAMADALAGGSFDLVILDLMLPGEDGLSLRRRLRSKRRCLLSAERRRIAWSASKSMRTIVWSSLGAAQADCAHPDHHGFLFVLRELCGLNFRFPDKPEA